eukprot:768806-Hanusia_phi.AAC.2
MGKAKVCTGREAQKPCRSPGAQPAFNVPHVQIRTDTREGRLESNLTTWPLVQRMRASPELKRDVALRDNTLLTVTTQHTRTGRGQPDQGKGESKAASLACFYSRAAGLLHGSEPVVVGSSAAPLVETHTSSLLLLHRARSLLADHRLGIGTDRDPGPGRA